MTENDPEVLIQDFAFNCLVIMVLSTYYPGDANKRVVRLARKFQKQTKNKSARNVMEQICQAKFKAAEVSRETYQLIMTGDY